MLRNVSHVSSVVYQQYAPLDCNFVVDRFRWRVGVRLFRAGGVGLRQTAAQRDDHTGITGDIVMLGLEILHSFVARLLRAVMGSQRGGVVILWALATVPIVIGVGAAVDLSRAYMARSRLAFALDAAGLAAGAAGETESQMRAIAEQFFFANYPPNLPGTPATPTLTVT